MRIDEFRIGDTTSGFTGAENLSWVTFGLFDEEEATITRRTGDVVKYHFKPGLTIIDLTTGKKKKKKKRKKQKDLFVHDSFTIDGANILEHYRYHSHLIDSNNHFPFLAATNYFLRQESYTDTAHISSIVREDFRCCQVDVLEEQIDYCNRMIEHISLVSVHSCEIDYRETVREKFFHKNREEITIPYENIVQESFYIAEKLDISSNSQIVLREHDDFIINPQLIAAIVAFVEEDA